MGGWIFIVFSNPRRRIIRLKNRILIAFLLFILFFMTSSLVLNVYLLKRDREHRVFKSQVQRKIAVLRCELDTLQAYRARIDTVLWEGLGCEQALQLASRMVADSMKGYGGR